MVLRDLLSPGRGRRPVGSGLARADDDGIVAESNEANNLRSVAIRVGPDLSVTSLTGPASVHGDESFSIADTVRNVGGIADTVRNVGAADDHRDGGTGFVFAAASAADLMASVRRALEIDATSSCRCRVVAIHSRHIGRLTAPHPDHAGRMPLSYLKPNRWWRQGRIETAGQASNATSKPAPPARDPPSGQYACFSVRPSVFLA